MQKKISFTTLLVLIFNIFLMPFNIANADDDVTATSDWRLISGANFQEITSKSRVLSNTGYDSRTALEGFTIAGDYIVYSKVKENTDPTTIIIADKSGNPLGSNDSYNFGHANDMTYNSKTGEVVIPYYDAANKYHVAKFKIVKSGNNYSISTPVKTDVNAYYHGLGYIKEKDKYVAVVKSSLYILDNKFNIEKTNIVSFSF